MGYVNVNKLANKISSVGYLLNANDMDVLCIGETWLTDSVTDSYVEHMDYKIERKDDPSNIAKHGIAIYIKKSLKYEMVLCNSRNALVLKFIDQNFYIICVYRPPSNSIEDNAVLTSFLTGFCSDKESIVLGDFNLPSLKWDMEDPALGYVFPVDKQFLEAFNDLGLTQIIKEATNFPSGNIIDLCLVSHPERIGAVEVLPPILPACSHGVISVKYTFQDLVTAEMNMTRRIWTRGNFRMISEKLRDFDWMLEFLDLGTQQMYAKLCDITS